MKDNKKIKVEWFYRLSMFSFTQPIIILDITILSTLIYTYKPGYNEKNIIRISKNDHKIGVLVLEKVSKVQLMTDSINQLTNFIKKQFYSTKIR